MSLLIHRFVSDRVARPSAIGWQLLLVAAAAGGLGGVGFAVDSAVGIERKLGHALASGAVHSGFLAMGWVLAFQGRAGWAGPALREASALIVASVASRLSPAGAIAYLFVPLVVARDAAGWPTRLERIGWRWPREGRACRRLDDTWRRSPTTSAPMP